MSDFFCKKFALVLNRGYICRVLTGLTRSKDSDNPLKSKRIKINDNMKKYISVPNETKRDLRIIFNCTKEMVWKALNFKSDSDLAKKIRKLATDKGGVIFDESKQNIKIIK